MTGKSSVATHHVFADPDSAPPRFELTKSNPPGVGGVVIDTFSHPEETSHHELLAEAERRNGPLRIQYASGEFGEEYRANQPGLHEACAFCDGIARKGRDIRLVTSRNVLIKHWNPGRS